MTTRMSSHGMSSSSAIIIPTDVIAPCPISVCGQRTVQTPSGSMASQALISLPSSSPSQGFGITDWA